MGAVASKSAKIHIDVNGTPTAFGEVRSFSLDTTLGTIDVSVLSTDWKNFLVGQAGWSGSIECLYDPTDAAQAELASKVIAGTACTLTLYPLERPPASPSYPARHLSPHGMSRERQRTQWGYPCLIRGLGLCPSPWLLSVSKRKGLD